MSMAKINWTPAMDAILGTDRDAAIAGKLGLSYHHIAARRKELGIKGCFPLPQKEWTPEDDAVLGTNTLMNVSAQLGRPITQILKRMLQLGVDRFAEPGRPRNILPSQKTVDREREKVARMARKESRYYENLQKGSDVAEYIARGETLTLTAHELGITLDTVRRRLKLFLIEMRKPDRLGELIPLVDWKSIPPSIYEDAVRLSRIEIEQRDPSIKLAAAKKEKA